MADFHTLLLEIKGDCSWECVPEEKISALARLCGPTEIDHLIRELDALDDADLIDDAGDGIDEYWRLRTSYSRALAEVGEPAVAPLLRALGSQNPQTRAYAADALGAIGDPRAFDPLTALLARESIDTLRMSLLRALGGLKDPRAVRVLLPYLKAPDQVNRGWMIRVAANALGQIGSEEAIGPLAEVLASDPDWFARLGAAEGLRKMRHPSAIAALRVALRDEDARVRDEAAAGVPGA
jgi:HEAT repeat protein